MTAEPSPVVDPTKPIRSVGERRKRFKIILGYALALGVLLIAAGLYVGGKMLSPYYQAAQAYDLSNLNSQPLSTVLIDRKGNALGYLYAEDRISLPLAGIPDRFREAMVAAEDRRFYAHRGFDLKGIARAASVNLQKGKIIQGGSTITQQLAKNIIGDSRRTWDRKWKEAFLAWRLERTFSKDELMTFYLNRVYFGSGYFGLAAATEGYFDKKPAFLTTTEAAMLAGAIRAPSSYSPRRSYNKAWERCLRVLDTMQELGFITAEERVEAEKERPKVKETALTGLNSHYRARIIAETEQILELTHREQVPQGLRIYSSLDTDLQTQVEQTVEQEIRRLEEKGVKGATQKLEAAVVVLDPADGQILAYVGGRNFEKRQFDHASQARRQPAGLLNPWIAGLGIEKLGLSPVSLLDSGYIDPSTYSWSMDPATLVKKQPDRDSIILHDALSYGNDFAIWRVQGALPKGALFDFLGRAQLNIPERTNESNYLHWLPLTLLENTALAGTWAGSGQIQSPRLLQKIETMSGETLFQARPQAAAPLLAPETMAEIRWAMGEKARDGSGRLVQQTAGLQGPRAIYHATSSGYLDSTCLGVTPKRAVGVWLGVVDAKETVFTGRQQAEEAVLPLWTHVVDAAALGSDARAVFPAPPTVTEVEIDRRGGQVKGYSLLGGSEVNTQVLLTKPQMDALQRQGDTPAETSQTVSSWSQWFGSILAEEKPAVLPGPTGQAETALIPEDLEFVIPGGRGKILTRDGQILATTVKDQALDCAWPSPQEATGDEAVLAAVRKRIQAVEQALLLKVTLSDQDILERYRYRRFQPLELAQVLDASQVEKFLNSGLERMGLALQGYPRRFYPFGGTMAHTLGYLRKSQSVNLGRYQAGEIVADDYAGASGLEALFDTELHGVSGVMKINTRKDGFLNHVEVPRAPQSGSNLRLTIHSRWQKSLEEAINTEVPAAGIIMDVRNGDILAMASHPGFDPNEFIPRMNSEAWQALSENSFHPLVNRVYRQHYPPGSIFKIVTALMGLQAGTLDPEREVTCTGSYTVGNVVYHMAREKGVVNFRLGMAYSFNTYFFDLALRNTKEALINMGKACGFGQQTGFILPNELTGCMPDQDYVRRTHNRTFGAGDVTNTSIGQGDVLVTPLQLVRFISAVANRGTFYEPRLVAQLEDDSGSKLKAFAPVKQSQLSLPDEQWNLLHQALRAVVLEGTAQQLQIPHLDIAGKTGTAQAGASKDRQVAWAAGFAPYDKPQFAFVFVVEGQAEGNVSGSHHAVPMARRAIEGAMSVAR